MTNLTNFNNFELNTEETTNVNGGRCRRRTSYNRCGGSYSRYSSNTCYSSYNRCGSYSYSNCEPAVEAVEIKEPVIEIAPVVEAPALPIAKAPQGIQGA